MIDDDEPVHIPIKRGGGSNLVLLAVAVLGLFATITVAVAYWRTSGGRQEVPQGDFLRVRQFGKIYFTTDQKWVAVVEYESGLTDADSAALKQQAAGLLRKLEPQLNSAGVSDAIFKLVNVDEGLILTTTEPRVSFSATRTDRAWELTP